MPSSKPEEQPEREELHPQDVVRRLQDQLNVLMMDVTGQARVYRYILPSSFDAGVSLIRDALVDWEGVLREQRMMEEQPAQAVANKKG